MKPQSQKEKTEAIAPLRAKISRCFGGQDNIFAWHPSDEQRAKELRTFATENNIKLSMVQDIALEYLNSQHAPAEQIIVQMKKVTDFFSKKKSK
jgi:hypothetical protein